LKPINARKGANTSGNASMTATSVAGTLSSTIITRFSVPTSITMAMPTVTWNKDRRSSRVSGRVSVATSAKGMYRAPTDDNVRSASSLKPNIQEKPVFFGLTAE
jgi:hypothetical protein